MAIYQGHNEDSSGNLLLSIGNGMTATVETGTKASQAYTKGQYLFFDNKLCKASTAIAANATLAIGTNLTQTSLGAELTSHLRSSDGKEFYFDVKDGKYGYYPSASKTASEFVPFGGTSLVAKGKYHRWFYGDIATQNKMNQSFTNIIDTTAPPYYSTMLANVSDKNSVTISTIGSGEVYFSCYLMKSDGTLSSFYPRGTTSINLSGYDYLWACTYNSTTGYTRLTFS